MRKYPWLKTLLWSVICAIMAALLVFGICTSVHADALQVTQTVPVDTTGNVAVPVTVELTNTLTAQPPITLTATVEWTDEYLVDQSVTASAQFTVKKPISIKTYKLPIPTGFQFVTGSAKVDSTTITPTLTNGVLVCPINKSLTEGSKSTLTLSIKPF